MSIRPTTIYKLVSSVILCCCFSMPSALAAPCDTPIIATAGTQVLRPIDTTCAPLGYSEYTPANYESTEGFPLLIAFHGDGQVGTGSARDIVKIDDDGLPKEIRLDRWDPQHRFVVLAPQMTKAQRTALNVRDFIEFAKANYKIDPRRIYLTALSGGGRPLYVYMHTYAGADVAAVIPISSVFIASSNICSWKAVPMWLFHGASDTIVLPIHSERALFSMNKCKPVVQPKYTKYTGVLHNAWARTYSLAGMFGTVEPDTQMYDQSIYDWLLQYSL